MYPVAGFTRTWDVCVLVKATPIVVSASGANTNESARVWLYPHRGPIRPAYPIVLTQSVNWPSGTCFWETRSLRPCHGPLKGSLSSARGIGLAPRSARIGLAPLVSNDVIHE